MDVNISLKIGENLIRNATLSFVESDPDAISEFSVTGEFGHDEIASMVRAYGASPVMGFTGDAENCSPGDLLYTLEDMGFTVIWPEEWRLEASEEITESCVN
ncbi:hypothetical protein C3408_22785 [Candidatus Pantoea alvi]|uniref:hypothetical protein n=1 Tax=Pantoea septica TaxID=472695 RepID=UPI000CDD7AF1|nr:hypothetical protein [Pantoea septica]POW54672.1 hypothetical protein C3408_22785 [Pantoea alvi]